MMNRFKIGWQLLQRHSKLMLIAWLIILFPLLFVFSFQSLITVTKNNATTTNLQYINSFQDNVEFILKTEVDPATYIDSLKAKQTNLTKLRLVKEESGQLMVTSSLHNEKVGQIETDTSGYHTALINIGETFVFNYDSERRKLAQAFRAVEMTEGSVVYIFSEHDLTKIDSVINTRIQQSYLTLSFIFLFLIILAYWLARQINYENKYRQTLQKLHDRDLFTNSLAHELRAPLTAVRGYASLILETEGLSGEVKSHTERIRTSTTRLVNLINDFLEAARIQSGALKFKFNHFDVVPVVKKVAEELGPNAEKKSLTVTLSLPEGQCIINSDSARLEQILTNILSNAIKYTQKGNIKIEVKSSAKFIEFIIADSGFGISAKDQKKLFDPFVRVGSASKDPNVTGSGLGMWITKQLVEQLNGVIEIESIQGVGTHVIVRLLKGLGD